MLTRRNVNLVAGDLAASALPGLGQARALDDADVLAGVDPELRDAARAMLAQPSQPITRDTLPAVRLSWPPPPPLAAPSVAIRRIPGPPGAPDVTVEVIGQTTAPGPARPAIVHMHGGGMISGRAAHSTAFCQHLAAEFDCLVVNVDYRLAPETPFPGPVEDNYAALKWLFSNRTALGVDGRRIAVMGESAGGGHAALLALLARDRGEIPICLQVLIYPMLDDRTGSTVRPTSPVGAIGWSAEANAFGWSAFLGVPAGSGRHPSGGVPARVTDLSGLPPAFISVGSIDLFVDEDMEYARRLVNAGVPTQLVVAPRAYHAFDFVVPGARVSQAFIAAWKSAIRASFAAA